MNALRIYYANVNSRNTNAAFNSNSTKRHQIVFRVCLLTSVKRIYLFGEDGGQAFLWISRFYLSNPHQSLYFQTFLFERLLLNVNEKYKWFNFLGCVIQFVPRLTTVDGEIFSIYYLWFCVKINNMRIHNN